jgi:membrane protein
MNLKAAYELVRDAGMEWWDDKAPSLGAALAFYTALSLSPILLIVIGVCGLVFGQDAAQGQIVAQLRDLIGEQGAQAIEAMIANAWSPASGIIALIVGIVTLLIGATGVFAQLQDSLNTVWEVPPRSGTGILLLFKERLLSLAMILSLGFLLLVSLVVNAALSALGTYCAGLVPGGWTILLHVVNFLLTFGVTLVMFALIFKLLPDARIAWSDVWVGSAITALLFMVGKYLIGIYLGASAVGSSYGAAGSFVVLMLWLYYSTQILLFGAEFTQVYANRFGHGLEPAAHESAVPRPAAAAGQAARDLHR